VDKEKAKLKNKAKKQLGSAIESVVLWTAKRERYPTLKGQLLPMAKRLEKAGLLKYPKKQRLILMEKALSVLNFAEARAKTRMWSTVEILASSERVYRKILKEANSNV
jgi:hypothetical protein